MVILKSITPKPADGRHVFTCIFDVDSSGDILVDLVTAEMGDYNAFKYAVMDKSGILFQLEIAEGRPPEQANYFWQREVGFHLTVARHAVMQKAGSAVN